MGETLTEDDMIEGQRISYEHRWKALEQEKEKYDKYTFRKPISMENPVFDERSEQSSTKWPLQRPLDLVRVNLTYPLYKSKQASIQPNDVKLGMSPNEFVHAAAKMFHMIYDRELETCTTPPQKMSNGYRSATDGDYGVFGVELKEIYLTGIWYNPSSNTIELLLKIQHS